MLVSVICRFLTVPWIALQCDCGLHFFLFLFVCLFVCFVALRPKSTAMVMAGRSVHLATLFPGQA